MNELKATRLKLKCLEMVEGTNIHWHSVVRFNDTKHQVRRELSEYEEDSLEFATGIVNGVVKFNEA